MAPCNGYIDTMLYKRYSQTAKPSWYHTNYKAGIAQLLLPGMHPAYKHSDGNAAAQYRTLLACLFRLRRSSQLSMQAITPG